MRARNPTQWLAQAERRFRAWPHGPRIIGHRDRPRSPGALGRAGLAEQAFSRATGVPIVTGNSIRLLKDARENYPAWLDSIAQATRWVHLESYIIHEDAAGQQFSAALIEKARA